MADPRYKGLVSFIYPKEHYMVSNDSSQAKAYDCVKEDLMKNKKKLKKKGRLVLDGIAKIQKPFAYTTDPIRVSNSFADIYITDIILNINDQISEEERLFPISFSQLAKAKKIEKLARAVRELDDLAGGRGLLFDTTDSCQLIGIGIYGLTRGDSAIANNLLDGLRNRGVPEEIIKFPLFITKESLKVASHSDFPAKYGGLGFNLRSGMPTIEPNSDLLKNCRKLAGENLEGVYPIYSYGKDCFRADFLESTVIGVRTPIFTNESAFGKKLYEYSRNVNEMMNNTKGKLKNIDKLIESLTPSQ